MYIFNNKTKTTETDVHPHSLDTTFVTGTRSLNEEEIKKNLFYFEVPSGGVEPIRVKLTMTIFDEYTNILKGEDPTTGTLLPE